MERRDYLNKNQRKKSENFFKTWWDWRGGDTELSQADRGNKLNKFNQDKLSKMYFLKHLYV